MADYSLQKSASFDSSYTRQQPQPKFASTYPLKREKASKLKRMDAIMGNNNHLTKTKIMQKSVFEAIEEDEPCNGASVESKITSDAPMSSDAFMEQILRENYSQPQNYSETTSTSDVGVSGMEISNSSTETTVVLKHLLALSGKNSHSSPSHNHNHDMAIIEEDELEEDEESYYESQDTPLSSDSGTPKSFTLPHPIPKLFITDESGALVETVVDTAKEYTNGSAVWSPIHISADIRPADVGPATIASLGLIEEDEEDESDLSTSL